jgi:hypothetical protein
MKILMDADGADFYPIERKLENWIVQDAKPFPGK